MRPKHFQKFPDEVKEIYRLRTFAEEGNWVAFARILGKHNDNLTELCMDQIDSNLIYITVRLSGNNIAFRFLSSLKLSEKEMDIYEAKYREVDAYTRATPSFSIAEMQKAFGLYK